eukprot:m.382960 g.382960  ORF g.382960 m.382960 type:complete len:56 (+) comp120437_c0_seq1:32-199(+)
MPPCAPHMDETGPQQFPCVSVPLVCLLIRSDICLIVDRHDMFVHTRAFIFLSFLI